MANLNDFIEVEDNSLDEETCQFLIDLFEQNPERYEFGNSQYHTVFNLTEVRKLSNEVDSIHNNLIKTVYEYRDRYYSLFDSRVFPQSHAFEQFKIEKYDINDEYQFETNVDVIDHSSARRFLSFMWFLNNNKSGQIQFLDLFIQPEQGKLLVYPPFWMFPYKKFEPSLEPQYILKTYLHYK